MEKWKIQFDRGISESEFFAYLDQISPNEQVKSHILAFYQKLKTSRKNRPLTKALVGISPFKRDGKQMLFDVAKHLFRDKREIGYDELFRYNFCNFLQKIHYTHQEDDTKAYITLLGDTGVLSIFDKDKHDKQLQRDYNETVLANPKQFCDNDCKNNDMLARNLMTDKIVAELAFKEERRAIFHELYHLMGLRTIDMGKYRMLDPNFLYDASTGYGLCFISSVNLEFTEDMDRDYFRGLRVLTEINTEMASLDFSSKNISQYDFQDSAASPKKEFFSVRETTDEHFFHHENISYHKYAPLVYLMQLTGFQKDAEEYVLSGQTVRKRLCEFRPSIEMKKFCEKLITERYGLDKSQAKQALKGALPFDIFTLLVGNCVCEELDQREESMQAIGIESDIDFACSNDSERDFYDFDKFYQTAQAVILDAKKQQLLNVMIGNSANENQELLKNEMKKCKKIDGWIVKPNTVLTIQNNKKLYQRDFLSNSALLEKNQDSISLAAWVDYLTFLQNAAIPFENLSQNNDIRKFSLLKKTPHKTQELEAGK